MSPLYIYNGKILVKNGKLAGNEDCCCDGDNRCSYIEIIYDWTFGNNVDLDTQTIFNGKRVGWSCPDCPAVGCGDQYITWDGDNTNQSGTERVVVLVKKALDNGVWNNQTSIELNAYWFVPNPQNGPTKIFIRLFRDDGSLCKEICCLTDNLPELQGCVQNLVGTVIVKEINNEIDFEISCNSCETGACCLPDTATCLENLTQAECEAQNGIFYIGIGCETEPCASPPPSPTPSP